MGEFFEFGKETIEDSHGEMYENNIDGTTLALTVIDTFYKWISSTVGLETGIGYVVGDSTNSNITVGIKGAGTYNVALNSLYDAPEGTDISVAVFKNDVKQLNLSKTIEVPGGHEHRVDSVTTIRGTTIVSDTTNVFSQDVTYYQVQELNEDTGWAVDFDFHGVNVPSKVVFIGRYDGGGGHDVEVQICDFTRSADEVQHGGTAYRCIRDNTSGGTGAGDEPGTGVQWESYWVSIGAPTGQAAWDTVGGTVYDDAFDDVRAAAGDLPSATVDYSREWLIPGTSTDRQKYRGTAGAIKIRFIHKSNGTAAHNIYFDKVAVHDESSGRSTSGSGCLALVAGDVVDVRFSSSVANIDLAVHGINLVINRVGK